jgi:recombination protein RecT
LSNEIATQQEVQPINLLRSFLESPTVMKQLSLAIPGAMKPERLVRQAITLAQVNPDLLKCSRLSVIAGIMQAAQLGLELSGPLGHAYLVPRFIKKNNQWEASFQVGWKGLVVLSFRSGNVASFPVRSVYEGDSFKVSLGTTHSLMHEPVYTGDRGKVIGHYALVIYKNGGHDFEYMTCEEVEAHRIKYGGKGPAWGPTGRLTMEQKTVVRSLCRRLSLCPEAQTQAMNEEYEESGVLVPPPLDVKEGAMIIDQVMPSLEFTGGPDPADDPKDDGQSNANG